LTFADLLTDDYSRAVLGVYEMNRAALLRDLYLWAYEWARLIAEHFSRQ
jgi:hypothetical protein